MNVFLIVAAVVAMLIMCLLIVAAMKPNSFRIERSARIVATPEKIFPFIADFHKWPAWSPFEKMDTNLSRRYEGTDSGKGAIYAWDGKKAGAGRMEIIEAIPSKTIIKLDFSRPMTAHNIAEFTLVPNDEATIVTWAMHGPSPFITKLMHTVMSMDKMVGPMFEEGLASLKTATEQ